MDEAKTDDRSSLTRREFLEGATAMGALGAWARPARKSNVLVNAERRDLFPEGVASGDPDAHSVIIWTRYPVPSRSDAVLHTEVSESPEFDQVVVTASTTASVESDWTCRVLVGNLEPSRIYWYRFIDSAGNTSRVGRTITAPLVTDPRPVSFAFVSCQNANMGEQHAYRRMIYDDEHAPRDQQLEFVLHLGDFIYEVVWYPEDRPAGMFERRLRDVVRYPEGEKIDDFHIPASVEDYRAIYRAYLHDADLQDARARWPFVCIWDNHEFSWNGWQSIQVFSGQNRPAQTRKVAANQAWFEYQPARVTNTRPGGLRYFNPPRVHNAPIEKFDEHGLGLESNNQKALASLTGYRSMRWGRNVDLFVTDQRSYRSEDPTVRPEAKKLFPEEFPEMLPQECMELLDAGQAYASGQPPDTIRVGAREFPNFRKNQPPQSILGERQKRWFINQLRSSKGTWKIWGNTLGTLDYRADPQNLPEGLTAPWPGAGYATFRGGDASTAYIERAEIYAAVREANISGFVTLAGDRHSFWAGRAAAHLPPLSFDPVGIAFVVGSISAPGLAEKLERGMSDSHPLRALYMQRRSAQAMREPTVNMLVRHGVRACLEYQRTGDINTARRLSNPDLSPHLSFVDFAGHGFAIVRASPEALECEFVCIPRPDERVTAPDGGPIRYRVTHSARIWQGSRAPPLEQRVIEGDASLSL